MLFYEVIGMFNIQFFIVDKMKAPSLSIFILTLPVLATKYLIPIKYFSYFPISLKKELLSPANLRRILSTKNRKIYNSFLQIL